jgi:hypothetical protein
MSAVASPLPNPPPEGEGAISAAVVQVRTPKSKTLATWIAVIGGLLGAHRFYLHGRRDVFGWMHPPLALAGIVGVIRTLNLGQDDRVSWLLLPLLGIAITAGMIAALVIGLTSDARWAERFAPGAPAQATGFGAILGVMVALLLGATVLMSTIAYAGQRFFEWQLEQPL